MVTLAARLKIRCAAAIVVASLPSLALAQQEDFALHAQFTYVDQATSGFRDPYHGRNSLSPNTGAETTDLTLYAGRRLWQGAELWVNAEIDQGFGLDDTLGAAGFPSGEAYKVGKNAPYLRLPRLFIRQTLSLKGNEEDLAASANVLAGTQGDNRIVISTGKLSVADIFDTNQYAHDARNDFLNWTAIDAGTFDYAADAWGYTVGSAAEWYQGTWTMRGGFFDLSDVPNSPRLEPGFHEFQVVAEAEHRHELFGRAGRLLLTGFDSRGRMADLNQAVRNAQTTDTLPVLAPLRTFRSRVGLDVDLEQQINNQLGLFARIGKAGGNVETYEFTDVDRSVSAGVSMQGKPWRRADDTLGFAVIQNSASGARERFLNAGGLGILIGDGQLAHPAPEQIIESFYSLGVLHYLHVALDYQLISHPGYNRDRGPVSVLALRVHAQY